MGSAGSEFWFGLAVFLAVGLIGVLFMMALPVFFYTMREYIVPFFSCWYHYWQWR